MVKTTITKKINIPDEKSSPEEKIYEIIEGAENHILYPI